MTDRLSLRQTSVTCPRLQSDHLKANEIAAPLHTVVLQHFLWVMVWSSEYDSELVLSWGNEARKSCFVCGVLAETSAEMWNTTSGGFMLLHTNRDIFCWDTDRGPQSPADITLLFVLMLLNHQDSDYCHPSMLALALHALLTSWAGRVALHRVTYKYLAWFCLLNTKLGF